MENTQAAIIACRNNISLRKASKKFHVSRKTLTKHLNDVSLRNLGGQQKFSCTERKAENGTVTNVGNGLLDWKLCTRKGG